MLLGWSSRPPATMKGKWQGVITLTAKTGPYVLKANTGPVTLTADTGPYTLSANTGPIVLTAKTTL